MKADLTRRSFLKTAALIGSAFAVGPAAERLHAAGTVSHPDIKKNDIEHRTLGHGDAAMDVSAIGFGCMGLNYNRSQSPDKKECIRIIHEAVERGVTLFDTAIIYGPLRNELLAGEALVPYKGRYQGRLKNHISLKIFRL